MIKLLVYAAIILGIIAIAQLVRVAEISSGLRGGRPNDITEKDNRLNARMMMLFLIGFFIFCYWQLVKYEDKLLPVSASVHGDTLDWLFNFNMIIIAIVFVLTHIIMFTFAYKYYGKPNRTATYYPHNNKLEFIWTIIPAIVLAVIIIYGLKTWNTITEPAKADAMVVEVYGKQFDWTIRYAGTDNKLGESNYKLITGTNPLGIDSTDSHAWDDIIVRNEFHLPLGKDVDFQFRSRDVIHSAFFPHFRAQMNCVPGMVTTFHFVPQYTTKKMREITKNDKFDYILLCNKICGASHYNMQAVIVVDQEADFKKWLGDQKKYKGAVEKSTSASTTEGAAAESATIANDANETGKKEENKDSGTATQK
jgi:cytochrome c oxidase subunit II